jgi:molecular chaperone IbpA
MTTRRFNAANFNDPFFIGFDRMLDRMTATTPGQTNNYPPYNIIKVDEDNYAIELAVAGFIEDEINIEVKEGVLYVLGEKDKEESSEYLHKGISARSFHRSFTLSDTIVVKGADLQQGILTIELENIIPEEKKPRKIDIGKSKKTSLKG